MATPNILIILADDLGVDSFRVDKTSRQVVAQITGQGDSAGPVRLPSFERMLANGLHFEKAWAHPVCTPTRASLWTGMQAWKTGLGYPSTTGDDSLPNNTVVGTPIQSLAQALKAQTSYRCAMFGKWDLGAAKNPVQLGWDYFAGIFAGGLRPVGVREYGFPQPPSRVGYDRLRAATGSTNSSLCAASAALLASKYGEPFLRSNPDLRFYIWHKDVVQANGTVSAAQPPSAREQPYATADEVADAKQWIAAQGDHPWCVALTLITPHDPVHLPPPGTYRPDTISDPANPSVQDLLVAMISSMDYYVGDLLQSIDRLANTVVIFAGDNGTQDIDPDTGQSVDAILGDDKGSASVGGVHVPMLIADGGRMKGGAPCYVTVAPRSVGDPVHIIDVYRTALDIAGVGSPAPSDSISIVPYLTGAAGQRRVHNFSQMYIAAQLAPDGVTAFSPGTSSAASDGSYMLGCSALLAGTPPQTYLVDELGTKVRAPVFDYRYARLDPEPGIPGSVIETTIPALQRYGSAFAITDPAHRDRILGLYATLSRERLDSSQRRFPYIGDAAPLVAIDGFSLEQGQSRQTPAMDLHAIDFTIAAKVKVATTANRNIILGNWGSAGNSWQLLFAVLAGGAPYVSLRRDMVTDGSNPQQGLLDVQGSTSLAAGVLTHVACTFTWGADRVSPCCTIYVAGVEVGRAAPQIVPIAGVRDPYALMPTSNPYLIGHKEDSSDSDSWFSGAMQSFRVFGVALDATRISQLALA